MTLRPLLRRAALAALVLAVFAAGLAAGVGIREAGADPGERYRALDLFAQVLAHVENGYVDDVAERELVHGAIDGMLERLDPHTAFLPPELHRDMREETRGEFEGVGLELGSREGRLVVIAPISGGPADRAGVRAGEHVAAIDGESTATLAVVEAARKLKGLAGTQVRLTIHGSAGGPPREVAIVRERIRTDSVEARVADREQGLVVVRVKVFQERTDRALKRALDAARAELKGEIRGLVLDLRNNPGGLLDEAVRVSDRFLRAGVIVSTEGRDQRQIEVAEAHERETEPAYPMAVLVDGGSASASEIVAGALQDHARATVVGTRSYGKGSVQQILDLSDGSALKLTVARYFTPKHRSIQGQGITPDLEVPAAPADPAGAQVANASAAIPRDAPLEAALTHLSLRAAAISR